jgi:hypothetical protein
MSNKVITRLAAANPVPHDGTLHVLEEVRLRRSWRPMLGVAVALVALAGAGVAVAAGFGAFEGTPAPPDVSANFAQGNKMADTAIQEGFGQQLPQADVSKAHGVIEIQTPDGPQDLWAAPNDQGGQCFFIDYANDPVGSSGGEPGSGGCITPDAYGDSKIVADGPEWGIDHPDLLTIYGSVEVAAATVNIALQDGSTLTAPVAEHFFLASIPKPATGGAKLGKVTAFDATGTKVAEWTPSQ